MFKRIYIEITNICNLNCSFCPGTKRKKRFMPLEDFGEILKKIKGYTEYIYLHVMGEPLLHPQFEEIINLAEKNNFTVNITTNGVLVGKKSEFLLKSKCIGKISVSLHSFEGNGFEKSNLETYLDGVYSVYKDFHGIMALRLWNSGGNDTFNDEIISYFSEKTGVDIKNLPTSNGDRKISENRFLENDSKFDWPSLESNERNVNFCHGLTRQLAILVDGTVVPCCLDSDGNINLGNIFEKSLPEILKSDRVKNFLYGMKCRKPNEELCRKCGFAERFTK